MQQTALTPAAREPPFEPDKQHLVVVTMIATQAFPKRDLHAERSGRNNLHRWFDPKIGRWISEDPIGYAGGDANLYLYVGNSPSNFHDPSGLQERRQSNFFERFAFTEEFRRDVLGHDVPPSPNNTNRWLEPFIYDPRTEYVGKVPMYDWIVGNLWHRSGLDDVASQIARNMGNPVPGPTLGDIVLGAIDTVTNWDKVSDLDKQDIPAQVALGFITGNVLRGTQLCPASKTGVDDFVPNTPVGRRTKIMSEADPSPHRPQHVNSPLQPVQNSPGTVNGIDFSGHAFDQMRNRGVTPTVVENALRTGTRTPGNTPGTTVVTDAVNKVKVVINSQGRVITVE